MLEIGTLLRVIYPEYAAGCLGRIEGQEESGRWLVRVEPDELEDDGPLILSLDESEFELVEVITETKIRKKQIADLIYYRSRYQGEVKPENLVFNSNLQEFAQRIGYISGLEKNGKLSPLEAYKQIKSLWKQLKRSKKQLGIGQNPFNT